MTAQLSEYATSGPSMAGDDGNGGGSSSNDGSSSGGGGNVVVVDDESAAAVLTVAAASASATNVTAERVVLISFKIEDNGVGVNDEDTMDVGQQDDTGLGQIIVRSSSFSNGSSG